MHLMHLFAVQETDQGMELHYKRQLQCYVCLHEPYSTRTAHLQEQKNFVTANMFRKDKGCGLNLLVTSHNIRGAE